MQLVPPSKVAHAHVWSYMIKVMIRLNFEFLDLSGKIQISITTIITFKKLLNDIVPTILIYKVNKICSIFNNQRLPQPIKAMNGTVNEMQSQINKTQKQLTEIKSLIWLKIAQNKSLEVLSNDVQTSMTKLNGNYS